jgi:16S rRNA processing protein RimM
LAPARRPKVRGPRPAKRALADRERDHAGVTPTTADSLVPLGVVVKPHGVRGDLLVKVHNPASTLLLEQTVVTLRAHGTARPLAILHARPHGRLIVIRVEGVVDRDGADALRGAELCILRRDFPEPEDSDEYYHVDLIGLRVEHPDGAVLGEVVNVLDYPSVACLEVLANGVVREVPMLDRYVPSIDLPAGRIVVDHLDELP